jgi:NAD(P)-dependent dehydrogenase (short-subunit alcohol dehydrogenase family)
VLAWAKQFGADNAMGRNGEPATDIAPAIVFLASDDSQWITGENLNVDGGFSATISI